MLDFYFDSLTRNLLLYITVYPSCSADHIKIQYGFEHAELLLTSANQLLLSIFNYGPHSIISVSNQHREDEAEFRPNSFTGREARRVFDLSSLSSNMDIVETIGDERHLPSAFLALTCHMTLLAPAKRHASWGPACNEKGFPQHGARGEIA